MKTIEVNFQESWSTEKRKAAINQAVESQAPFRIKSLTVQPESDEEEEQEYTGGFHQLITARSAKLIIDTRS